MRIMEAQTLQTKPALYNEYGQVVDPEAAHAMAEVEDKVVSAQGELDELTKHLEATGGLPLSEAQKKNLEFLNKLVDKYPSAFVDVRSEKGRTYKVVVPDQGLSPNHVLVGGQDGFWVAGCEALSRSGAWSEVDWDGVFEGVVSGGPDVLRDGCTLDAKGQVSEEILERRGGRFFLVMTPLSVFKPDEKGENDRRYVADTIKNAEKVAERKKEEARVLDVDDTMKFFT